MSISGTITFGGTNYLVFVSENSLRHITEATKNTTMFILHEKSSLRCAFLLEGSNFKNYEKKNLKYLSSSESFVVWIVFLNLSQMCTFLEKVSALLGAL